MILFNLLIYFITHSKRLIINACKFLKKKVRYSKSLSKSQKEDYVAKKVIETLETMTEEANGNVAVEVQPEPTALAYTQEHVEIVPKDKAYSILFDEDTKKWAAVELLFDYKSGTMGGLKVVESNPSKYMIVERFQVLVGKNLL
jgi:hypothetical protein